MSRIGVCQGCLAAQRGVKSRIAIPHTCSIENKANMLTPKIFQSRAGFKANESIEPLSYSLSDDLYVTTQTRDFDGFKRWIVLHAGATMDIVDGLFYVTDRDERRQYDLDNSFESAELAFETFKKFYK